MRPVRRRGRLGPLSIVHIIAIELAAVAILAGIGADGNVIALVTAGLVAVVLLVVTWTPTAAGWWYERQVVRARLRRRNRAARAVRPDTVRHRPLTALAGLAPGLTVRAVADRGATIGVGQDPGGWFAALSVTGDDRLPLDRLTRLFEDSSIPVSALAVTSQTVPAPSTLLDPAAPARTSYLELTAHDRVAADQQVLVAVRLEPKSAAAAALTRGGGLTGVDKAVTALVNRTAKVLGGTGLTVRVLDPDALVAALAGSCPATADAGEPAPGAEVWTGWQAAGLAHAGLVLTRWPAHRPDELFAALTGLPADLVNVTITMRPAGSGVETRCVVRVAARPDALPETVTQAFALADRAGGRLQRLDGRHGPAVWATAPTAAVLR
ncbi:type VII secretion protein EccE [Actinoplanes philippinensis]|uniref:Type VII secretion protein EccE n=1 Tax=Actinoplanes philippinensis TaxID=35752 RepID=A0A1I2GVM7_9ACTN|nr:type VII secretion protein EccE [Actinoplanes philippinensis]